MASSSLASIVGATSARVAATPVSVAAFTGTRAAEALGVPAGVTEPWIKANPARTTAPIMVGSRQRVECVLAANSDRTPYGAIWLGGFSLPPGRGQHGSRKY